jgi:hypothetical protein
MITCNMTQIIHCWNKRCYVHMITDNMLTTFHYPVRNYDRLYSHTCEIITIIFVISGGCSDLKTPLHKTMSRDFRCDSPEFRNANRYSGNGRVVTLWFP